MDTWQYWQKKLPTREKIFASRVFKPLAPWFEHDHFWLFDRDRVALAAAIGLYCGMIPAPFQFACALAGAFILRANLPVALFSTLYTNPITLVPLYAVAYELGSWLLYGDAPHPDLIFPHFDNESFWQNFGSWAKAFGLPWLLGSVLMASTFALAGYALVQGIWRWHSRRKQSQSEKQSNSPSK